MQLQHTSTFKGHVTSVAFRPWKQRIGDSVRAARKRRHITQTTAADRAGVDRSYWSDIERGKKDVTTGYLHAIAIALGTTASALLETAENGWA